VNRGHYAWKPHGTHAPADTSDRPLSPLPQAIYPQGEFNHQSAYQYLETSKAVEELQKNLCAETCNFLQFQVLAARLLSPMHAVMTERSRWSSCKHVQNTTDSIVSPLWL
jgi:hypothetical protein